MLVVWVSNGGKGLVTITTWKSNTITALLLACMEEKNNGSMVRHPYGSTVVNKYQVSPESGATRRSPSTSINQTSGSIIHDAQTLISNSALRILGVLHPLPADLQAAAPLMVHFCHAHRNQLLQRVREPLDPLP